MATTSKNVLSVQHVFHEGKQVNLPAARIYLFDQSGRYIDSKPAADKPVTFDNIDPKRSYRVSIGPDLLMDGRQAPADLAARLATAQAVTQDYRPGMEAMISLPISASIAKIWLGTCENIHGTVKKQLGGGGTAPITTGNVQIFLIDFSATFHSRYSAADLLTLRNQLIAKLEATGTLPNLILALGLSLLTGSALANFLVAERTVLWPYWCGLIPEWRFAWSEITEVPINSDGTFSYIYCYYGAAPDLYFEVVQFIDGVEKEISDPDLACTVYYNYNGSTSVDIIVTDPDAIATLPGNPDLGFEYCWPTAIGNIDLSLIDGIESIGTGLTDDGAGHPVAFGGTLPLQMMFSPNLLSVAKYYRWSYRFADQTDFTQIHSSVSHRWQNVNYVPLPTPHFDINLVPVTLGPQVIGAAPNLYEIPDPNLPWIDINDPVDRPFAYFDSTEGVAGRYGMCTLMLELFDAAGNYLSCDNIRGLNTAGDKVGDPAGSPFFYILPEIGGPPMSYTNAPPFNVTDHGRLIFNIFVDNRPTACSLGSPNVPSGTANDCGFLVYNNLGQTVHIPYSATQGGNFINWSLAVYRGSHGLAVPPISGFTSAPPGSNFDNSVSTLLGNCVNEGGRAAFAVNLYAAARITNGYGWQTQYDSSATIAFALTPV